MPEITEESQMKIGQASGWRASRGVPGTDES